MSNKFIDLNISENIKKALYELNINEMFPIQEKTIPLLLEGKDLIGQAQTGTGKTASFVIPILERINLNQIKPQALILCPTRELAVQVSQDLQSIGKYTKVRTVTIYGGASIDVQINLLNTGVHVIVGTPGRILDILNRGFLNLKDIKIIVLDEADRMLDMGFIEDVEKIIQQTPKQRQTIMFSATISEAIQNLAQKYMKNYHFISVSSDEITLKNIEQIYCEANFYTRFNTLKSIFKKEKIKSAIIFCNTKISVKKLVQILRENKYRAAGLHGDLSQAQRNKTLSAFKDGKLQFLVATDVAARGLNISGISHIINYNIPKDPKQYVHRIGRTGRAGKYGKAISIVTEQDKEAWGAIKWFINMPIEKVDYLPPNLIKKEGSKEYKPKWQWA